MVAQFAVSKCELYHFAWCYSKYMYITYLLGSIFSTCFFKYVKRGQGKKGDFDYQSGNSQGILIPTLGVSPVQLKNNACWCYQ